MAKPFAFAMSTPSGAPVPVSSVSNDSSIVNTHTHHSPIQSQFSSHCILGYQENDSDDQVSSSICRFQANSWVPIFLGIKKIIQMSWVLGMKETLMVLVSLIIVILAVKGKSTKEMPILGLRFWILKVMFLETEFQSPN